MVVLAQLAEHRIVVPSVVGSSPTFHPNRRNLLCYSGLGGMWGSNPRHSEPQSDALPTELRPP